MDIIGAYALITAQLDKRRTQANSILGESNIDPWRKRFLSESLLANLWIDWNEFARRVIISSCAGSKTRNATIIPPRHGVNTEARIRHEFKRYSSGHTPTPFGVDAGPMEPTWAHSSGIIVAIGGINPANRGALLAAFGLSSTTGTRRVHLVRNACAHKSRTNRSDVRALRLYYETNHFVDPIDIIWATNKNTGDTAIFEWISDLEVVADLATQ